MGSWISLSVLTLSFFSRFSFLFLFIHLFQLKLRAFYPEEKICVVNSRSYLPQYLHLVGNEIIKIFLFCKFSIAKFIKQS